MKHFSFWLRGAVTAGLLMVVGLGAPPVAQAGPYTPIDLGTLGGSSSQAVAVNASGQVVGYSSTTGDAATHAFSWTAGRGMVDLGTLGGDSWARAVNASGQVAGDSRTASGGYGDVHAFSWTAARGMVDLGTLGGSISYVTGVDDAGQIVGYSVTTTGQTHAFSWTAAGGMVDLGALGGTFSQAVAVSAAGHVVGFATTTGDATSHAFSWTASGGMVDLGTLGGYSAGYAVNASGQVVGQSAKSGPWPPEEHAFSWTAGGGMVDLGTLGGSYSSGRAVSDSGQVVGWSTTSASQTHAFSWTAGGGMVDLGTLGGSYSQASAVNASGQIVGQSATTGDAMGPSHAFSWTAGAGMVDLGSLGGSYSTAVAVNDSGQVAGYSNTASGMQQAVLWAPSDSTPPDIAAQVSGTKGANDWYTDDVTVSWTVSEPDSPASLTTSGCDTKKVTADTATNGITFTCSASSDGGRSSKSVTIKRDAAAPTVTFAGASTYTIDQTVNLTCNAIDPTPGSGLATDPCTSALARGPAYSFGLGSHAVFVAATDFAGNTTTAKASFTVQVTYASLAVLTARFSTQPGVTDSLVSKLTAAERADGDGNATAKAGAIHAYQNEVAAQTGKALAKEQAATLTTLAAAL
jgi:probable HAF family extracellular repeat protein